MKGEAVIEQRDDGSRVMANSRGAVWVERDKGGGVVSRHYIEGYDRYAAVMPEDRFTILDAVKHELAVAVLDRPAKAQPSRPRRTQAVEQPLEQRAPAVPAVKRVVMTHECRQKLADEIPYDGGGVEVGGGLYGFLADDGATIVIADVAASPNNRFGDGDSGAVRIDIEGLVAIEERLIETAGWCLLGDVHSHPNFRDGSNWRASDADLRCWARELSRTSKIGSWIGLIISPRGGMEMEYRWSPPLFTCLVMSKGDDGKPAATVLELEIEPEPPERRRRR